MEYQVHYYTHPAALALPDCFLAVVGVNVLRVPAVILQYIAGTRLHPTARIRNEGGKYEEDRIDSCLGLCTVCN